MYLPLFPLPPNLNLFIYLSLGKTLQSIALIWTLLKQSPNGRPAAQKAVVITPASLIDVCSLSLPSPTPPLPHSHPYPPFLPLNYGIQNSHCMLQIELEQGNSEVVRFRAPQARVRERVHEEREGLNPRLHQNARATPSPHHVRAVS